MYKLLSHNDLDGIGCGIVAKLAFGDDVNVRYNSVQMLDREVERFLGEGNTGTELIITDLSVDEENENRIEEFIKKGGKVTLIDHHKTALHLNEYEWGNVTVEQADGKLTSATSLLYAWLIDKGFLEPTRAADEFVELVRQYDTWEWEKNGNDKARRLNALFFMVSFDEFESKMLERLQADAPFQFDPFEKQLLDMEDDKMSRYIRKKRREMVQLEHDGLFAGVVHAESYHSELGNELGKENPHLDYIVILNMGGRKVSFRTVHDDVDVSEVAGTFGGGGHAKASGASMSKEAFASYVEAAFQKEPLREDARHTRYNLKESPFGTIYRAPEGDLYFVHPKEDGRWGVERNGRIQEETYASFFDAEKALKRERNVWLLNDDQFVKFLMNRLEKAEKGE